jgi:hypothetical protein
MTATSLIAAVWRIGGNLTLIEGSRIEVCLPDTQDRHALIEELRSVRDEMLCELMIPVSSAGILEEL